jgi:hypothetical protein
LNRCAITTPTLSHTARPKMSHVKTLRTPTTDNAVARLARHARIVPCIMSRRAAGSGEPRRRRRKAPASQPGGHDREVGRLWERGCFNNWRGEPLLFRPLHYGKDTGRSISKGMKRLTSAQRKPDY